MEQTPKKITHESVATTTELAIILGLSARRIQQLVQDGIIIPAERGKYNLCDAVQRYISTVSKPSNNASDEQIERTRRAAEAKLKSAKAMIADIEAKELLGQMHRSEDVAAMTADLILSIRGAFLPLPGRLAIDVFSANDSSEASEIIRREVYKILEELSNYKYDSAKYEERVRSRLKMSDNSDSIAIDEEDDPTFLFGEE